LNLWEGLPDSEPGDVTPFLRLHDYMFSLLPDEHRDLAMKLLAYKVQNPSELPRIAIVLVGVGRQGSGKSLWASIVRDMFGNYGVALPSSALKSEFNPWIETALCVVIDEAVAEHVAQGASYLKKYIADKHTQLRDLYRKGRQVQNRAFFILTSNEAEVANYEEGDRRMFVVTSPVVHPEGAAFYQSVAAWMEKGGARKLLHYLKNYDLNGWRPPPAAPMTSEKRMAAAESRSPVQRLGMAMKEAKDDHFVIQTLDKMFNWASENETSAHAETASRAKQILTAIVNWPIRPYYTPEELSTMLPELTHAGGMITGFRGRRSGAGTPSGQISRELRSVQIPYLINSDHPEGFIYRGTRQQFLVVACHDEYTAPMSQADFSRMAEQWSTFGELRLKSAQGLQIRRPTT
jgi:hypothetical protein